MIFNNKSGFLIVPKKLWLISRYLKLNHDDRKPRYSLSKFSGLLSQLLGVTPKEGHKILQKHPELMNVDFCDIENSMNSLKSLHYKQSEIQQKPMILYCNAMTIENRHDVLQECGCVNITVPILAKYITVMNKEIIKLKSMGIIPFETNVAQKLEQCFTDIEVKLQTDYGDDTLLKYLRQAIIEEYLRRKLDITETDLAKLFKTYFRLKHKSIKSIVEMTNILLNDLKYSKERIIKNGFILHGDSDNLKRMIAEIKQIGGEDIRDVLYRRPKIIMSNCDSVQKIIEYIKAFNIPEVAVTKCLELLTLGPETVLQRLEDLNSIEEFQVLVSNPRVLRLVHYQNKARLRLDYLNQIKVRCASLHILSCGSKAFKRFAQDGTDRTKGKDIVVFLSKAFNRLEAEVRATLSRHPNWCFIPVVAIKNCYDILISRKFTPDDIYHNVHILLYSEKRILDKLSELQSRQTYVNLKLDVNSSLISNQKLLTLCLYLIEREFHFTGDGVWCDHHNLPVENFHNILPDFPESSSNVYKFGTKSSKRNQAANIS